jgi:alkylated DNA repair dioxygenase AlkB
MTQIPGLTLIHDYLSPIEQEMLLAEIDAQPWLGQLRRRVQHHGYRYDYKRRSVDPSMHLGPLPCWLQHLSERLCAPQAFMEAPDQCIINEYEPGQGISPHIDCEPCFGEVIASISLGSSCVMTFSHKSSPVRHHLLLTPGSLLLMQGEARHEWKHGIPAGKTDRIDGKTIQRARRVSVTFRRVALEASVDIAIA